ncbi:MAG: hypothetical protein ACI9TI_002287, partial [Natronomonas sp.]
NELSVIDDLSAASTVFNLAPLDNSVGERIDPFRDSSPQ